MHGERKTTNICILPVCFNQLWRTPAHTHAGSRTIGQCGRRHFRDNRTIARTSHLAVQYLCVNTFCCCTKNNNNKKTLILATDVSCRRWWNKQRNTYSDEWHADAEPNEIIGKTNFYCHFLQQANILQPQRENVSVRCLMCLLQK